MLKRIVVAVVGALLAASSSALAQTVPTTPATIDVTCHGYDEGATRAYNCIPVAHQQPLLATFVPPVGSVCNGGRVAEFPPGRIVFQIRCDDTGNVDPTPPPPTEDHDYEIASVRRYASSIDTADWLYFTWRARVAASRFEVTVRFQQGAFFTTCTERWYDPLAGEQEEETSIPDVCGPDEQWSSVTIAPADGRKCKGCGTFSRTALPERRSLSPQTADPHEVQSFIEETAYRAQIGATSAGSRTGR